MVRNLSNKEYTSLDKELTGDIQSYLSVKHVFVELFHFLRRLEVGENPADGGGATVSPKSSRLHFSFAYKLNPDGDKSLVG